MPQVALKIPPVFHAVSDTSVESLRSLILGAPALLLSCVGNDFGTKLTEVETLCSELRNPFAFVANTYTFNLIFFWFVCFNNESVQNVLISKTICGQFGSLLQR